MPDVLLLILSNLIDVPIYMVWKLSGFPACRVIKSDTNLDSFRL
jgi:malate/lactate dehydrogenase